MSSGTCPVMSARFSHAVGARRGGPGGGGPGATGADVHAAISHTTGSPPITRFTASPPEYGQPSGAG
jgi:hypothetical protein